MRFRWGRQGRLRASPGRSFPEGIQLRRAGSPAGPSAGAPPSGVKTRIGLCVFGGSGGGAAAPGRGEAGGNCASGKVSSPTWGGGYGYDRKISAQAPRARLRQPQVPLLFPSARSLSSRGAFLPLCAISPGQGLLPAGSLCFPAVYSPREFLFPLPPRRKRTKAVMANPTL